MIPPRMPRLLRLARIAALALALAPLASADEPKQYGGDQTPTFSGEGRFWFLALDGDLRVTDTDSTGAAVKGTFLGLTDEYDLDTTQGAPELVGRLNLGGSFGAIASYMEIGADGNPTLRRDVTFDGKVYNAGDYLSTALDLRYARGLLEWNVVDMLGVAGGITMGAAYIRFDADIERESGTPPVTTTSHETGHAPFPLIGVSGRLSPVPWFILRADVAGLGGAYGDIRGAWLDAAAGVYLLPYKNLAIGFGGRLLHVDIAKLDLGDNAKGEGRFTLYGVFAALEIRL